MRLENHSWSNYRRLLLAAAIVVVIGEASLDAQTQQRAKNRWEPAIRAFQAKDRVQQPPKGGIVFIGSSSIRGWDVDRFFPGLPVINRGFGGSQIADSVQFADRILLPYEPKVVVFYAGDNDIARGKTPEQVAADYRAFVNKVHDALPATRIVFISIKPSILRWRLVDQMRRANALIRAVTEKDPQLVFVDIDNPMIGTDGKPRPELFKDDGLHLTDEGFQLWSSLVMPYLNID